MALSSSQRVARARLGGLAAKAQGSTNTGPATAAAEARFEREVREEAAARGERLTIGELESRTRAKRALFFARLSYASSIARSERARARRERLASPAQ